MTHCRHPLLCTTDATALPLELGLYELLEALDKAHSRCNRWCCDRICRFDSVMMPCKLGDISNNSIYHFIFFIMLKKGNLYLMIVFDICGFNISKYKKTVA